MIIALAHSGDFDGANTHRKKILAQGRAPSADGYGALIQRLPGSSPEGNAEEALKLYEEARANEVQFNHFLFNNVISRLAKGCRIGEALEVYQHMSTAGINPSPITYATIISGYIRMDQVEAAEAMFAEMTSQQNYQPREHAFTSMLGLFTQKHPNKE
jgi:pentatricopeptide repeat protein